MRESVAGKRVWTDAELVMAADMLAAGAPVEAIAAAVGRSVNAVRIKASRVIACPLGGNQPTYGKGRTWRGGKRYWTRERTLEGLRAFVATTRGQLPNSDHDYSVLKKGHMEWPPASRVLEYCGSMADAWLAAGAPRSRYTRQWAPWTQEDDDYLLEHAGHETLRIIAARLGRTAGSCKRRLYDLGAGRARDAAGYLSMQQVAAEYNCPLARVKRLVASGELPAHKVKGGHYWRIDPGDCERIAGKLRAPKRTYRRTRPDLGDYERRYGYRRTIVNGRMQRVAVAS